MCDRALREPRPGAESRILRRQSKVMAHVDSVRMQDALRGARLRVLAAPAQLRRGGLAQHQLVVVAQEAAECTLPHEPPARQHLSPTHGAPAGRQGRVVPTSILEHLPSHGDRCEMPARLQQVVLLAAEREHGDAVAEQVRAVRVAELHEVVLHDEAVAHLPVRQPHLRPTPPDLIRPAYRYMEGSPRRAANLRLRDSCAVRRVPLTLVSPASSWPL